MGAGASLQSATTEQVAQYVQGIDTSSDAESQYRECAECVRREEIDGAEIERFARQNQINAFLERRINALGGARRFVAVHVRRTDFGGDDGAAGAEQTTQGFL